MPPRKLPRLQLTHLQLQLPHRQLPHLQMPLLQETQPPQLSDADKLHLLAKTFLVQIRDRFSDPPDLALLVSSLDPRIKHLRSLASPALRNKGLHFTSRDA